MQKGDLLCPEPLLSELGFGIDQNEDCHFATYVFTHCEVNLKFLMLSVYDITCIFNIFSNYDPPKKIVCDTDLYGNLSFQKYFAV